MNILTLNLLLSTLVFWAAARLYVLPRLDDWRPRTVLLPILLLHSLRHLGLMFLAPGAIYPGMPAQFAYPAAAGDMLASLLALAAIPAVAMNWRGARVLVWIFNIEGTVDLAFAITLATLHGAHVFMGAAYWIPAFWVPALLVTHYVAFVVLIRHRQRPAQRRPDETFLSAADGQARAQPPARHSDFVVQPVAERRERRESRRPGG